MAYILDTDVIIHLMDGDDPAMAGSLARLDGPKRMSVITRIEIEGGLSKDEDGLRRRRFEALGRGIDSLPFGEREAEAYRFLVEGFGFSRRRTLDRMVAAQALAQGFTLVTRNGDDFRDVPSLKILEI